MKLNSMLRFAGRSCSALAMFGMAMASDPLLTNTTVFRIPFAVDGAGPSVSGSAVLFAGVNDSAMEQVQTVDASAGGFKFTAPSDGKYSFAVRMTDNNGNLVGNEESLIPELDVVVDTIAPRLSFQLTDMGQGKVRVSWKCNETSVDPGSLRLEYAQGADGRWKPIAATAAATGQATITAQAGTSIEVRGSISDLAGNQGTGSAQTVTSQISNPASHMPETNSNSLSVPGNSQAVGPSPFSNPAMRQQPVYQDYEPQQATVDNSYSLPNSNSAANSYSTPGNSQSMSGITAPNGFVADEYGSSASLSSAAPLMMPTYPTLPPQNSNYAPAQQFNNAVQQPASEYQQQPSMPFDDESGYAGNASAFQNSAPAYQNSGPSFESSAPAYQASAPAPASNSRQIVNNQVFNIDYQVDDVGVSGVSAVELYVTETNGREWFRYGNDPDMRTPFQVDTRGEGTFGFAVRARNGLGFSQPAPQPGEQPNIVVTVDKTAPKVEMGRPLVLTANGGKIRVTWRMSEDNPSDTPIRLEYSTSNSGPWTALFDWQPDYGSFEMPIQPGMPQSVHFRVLARDVAGNITASQTNQPLLIDQRRPTARLLRVQPVSSGRSFGL